MTIVRSKTPDERWRICICTASSVWAVGGMAYPPCALRRYFAGHAGCDRGDDVGRHLELILAGADPVASRDPCKIRISKPHFAMLVFENQEPNRPIEPRVRLGGDELCSERGIAEHQQGGWPQLDTGSAGKLRLVDLIEEFDAFAGDIRFQFRNGLRHRVSAFHLDDAVVACRRPRDG